MGGRAVSSAAYIAREVAIDERTRERVDFTPEGQRAEIERLLAQGGKSQHGSIATLEAELKDDLVHNSIVLPDGAPSWAGDWRTLWNRAEKYEDEWAQRYYSRTPRLAAQHVGKATVALKGNILLPREFSVEEAIKASTDFARSKFAMNGMATQVAVHWRAGQPHMHYQVTTRTLGPEGFGRYATWSEPGVERKRRAEYLIAHLPKRAFAGWMRETRQVAATEINNVAAEAGLEVHVEERSFRDLDIAFLRELPVGPGQSGSRIGKNEERSEANVATAMAMPELIIKEAFANAAVLSEAQLKRAVQHRCRDDASFQTVWHRLVGEHHVIELGRNVRGQVMYASAGTVSHEKALVETAAELATRNVETSPQERERLAKVIAAYEAKKGFSLKDEQRSALEHVVFGGDLSLVQGLPGTGKTTIMEALRLYYETRNGVGSNTPARVRGAATAAVAAQNLSRESGIPSTTVAKILFDYEQAEKARAALANPGSDARTRTRAEAVLAECEETHLKPGDVLVCDEAGMIGTAELASLQRHARDVGARLVYVGDHEQLSAVSAGGAFRLLVERHGAALLADISRQKLTGDREASKAFVRGDTAAAMEHYDNAGKVLFSDTKDAGLAAFAERLMQLRDEYGAAEVIATANRNADIDRVCDAVRTARRARGELGAEHECFDMRLAVGDEVMFTENNSRLGELAGSTKKAGVLNGERGIVRAILTHEDGKKSGEVRAVVIEKLGPDGRPDGKRITFFDDDPVRLAYSYSVTTHKSQGQTKDVHLHYAGNESRSLALVAGTRHRHVYEVYADHETYKNGLRDLIREMNGDGRQENVVDYNVGQGKQRQFEAVAAYLEASATYNAAVAKATLASERTGKPLWQTAEWETAKALKVDREKLAQAIVGTRDMPVEEREKQWEQHRLFAGQGRLDRFSIEETARVRDVMLTPREREAKQAVEAFVELRRETLALSGEIAGTHKGRESEHPEYARLSEMKAMHDRDAAALVKDRQLYSRHLEGHDVTWSTVEAAARRQALVERAERIAVKGHDVTLLERFEAQIRKVDEHSKARNRAQLQTARAEAKELAIQILDAQLQDELPKTVRNRWMTFVHPVIKQRAAAEAEVERIKQEREGRMEGVRTPENEVEFPVSGRGGSGDIDRGAAGMTDATAGPRANPEPDTWLDDRGQPRELPSDEIAPPDVNWRDREADFAARAQEAGIEFDMAGPPRQPEAEWAARGKEIRQIFADAGVKVDAAEQTARMERVAQREVEAARAQKAGAMTDGQRARQGRAVVQSDAKWVDMIRSDREARVQAHPRVAMTDMSPERQKAHEQAIEKARMSPRRESWITFRMRVVEGFWGAIITKGESRIEKQAFTIAQVKREFFKEEMRRYEVALHEAGIPRSERIQMIGREAIQRAAEYGLDLDYARGRLTGLQRRGLDSVLRENKRLAEWGEAISLNRSKNEQSLPLRPTGDLTPDERRVHDEAVKQLAKSPSVPAAVISELERGKAADGARGNGGLLSVVWSSSRLTKAQAQIAVAEDETRRYGLMLEQSGLPPESVKKLVDREREFRHALYSEPGKGKDAGDRMRETLMQNLAGAYNMSARAIQENRIESLASSIASARVASSSEPNRQDLTERERDAHRIASDASRMDAREIAAMIRGHETAAAIDRVGREEGQSFHQAWNDAAVPPEEARRLVLEAEVRLYDDALRDSGITFRRRQELVEAEMGLRGRELGVPVAPAAQVERRDAEPTVEDTPAMWDRHQAIARQVLSREPATSTVERAARLTDEEVMGVIYRAEFAAREAYAKENGVGLADAARTVQVDPGVVRAHVAEIESARLEELKKEHVRVVQPLAEERDPVLEEPSVRSRMRDGRTDYERTFDRFVLASEIYGELDPVRDAVRRQSLRSGAAHLAEKLGWHEAEHGGREERAMAMRARSPAALRLFQRLEREAAEREQAKAQDKQKEQERDRGGGIDI
jgi:hypothetical protein